MKNSYLLFCCILISLFGSAQENYRDSENIKTVIFKPSGPERYAPIIKLGEKLHLSFDDLNADEQYYTYKIEHCQLDWTSSNLLDSEFVNGYADDRINDYENSFNTLQPYTNYRLTIPNEYTQLKISGNYMLYVFNENSELAFKRRFVVYEPKVIVGVNVVKSRDLNFIDEKQAVEFSITNSAIQLNNPKEEIKTVILQNNNWETAITGLQPQFFRGNQLIYKYNKETSYWGGNQFLYLDTKAIRSNSLNISRVELGTSIYQTYLYTDEERIGQPYTLFPDINGNFIVQTLKGDDDRIEADYSRVHFSLQCLENMDGKEIYVQGNFNNWQLSDNNKMDYNSSTGLYETNLLLKQGFYNYQYVTKSSDTMIRNYEIDGSHYQTDNNYTVLVYYKKFGDRYTKVIGVGFTNSKLVKN